MSHLDHGSNRDPGGVPRPEAAPQELQELLAGRALGEPSQDEAADRAASDWAGDAAGLDAAAGSLYLAMAASPAMESAGAPQAEPAAPEPVPTDVELRLRRLAETFITARHAANPEPASSLPRLARTEPAPRATPAPSPFRLTRTAPWLALAASLVLAAVGWFVALGPNSAPRTLAAAEVLREVRQRPDAITIPWSDWSDASVTAEVTGVTGEVVWSDTAQSGVMRLANLPAIPDAVYQLWIIDAERGMSQRVSGAIFDGGTGEALVTIDPQLRINKAAAFAVTIEAPGGTWVSDMTRRVVIAARPG